VGIAREDLSKHASNTLNSVPIQFNISREKTSQNAAKICFSEFVGTSSQTRVAVEFVIIGIKLQTKSFV